MISFPVLLNSNQRGAGLFLGLGLFLGSGGHGLGGIHDDADGLLALQAVGDLLSGNHGLDLVQLQLILLGQVGVLGFVHAAVVYGLMAQASNQVMAEYLRSTRTLLSQMAGYTPEQIESFIDDTFSSYIRLMAQNQQKQCPSLFYQRLVGEGALETLPKERVAFLSGMMAITMCAILDKLGQYEFGVE